MKPNYRRCISCRKVALKQEFWRLVRVSSTQEGSPLVVLDSGMGRSAYLCPQADCLKLAQKKDRLARALKATVSESVYKTLRQRLSSQQTLPQPPTNAQPT
ncbi:YlxR family protein [Stenomitos frigidus]|uniref:DUF448 domain-containing protein n=1 Tax=Stenomitos frigidus ULC18 TaxID=2107698 RepID=A0A2T1ELG4_9CYAN|nr:YlxR family protein [Stenomitos frigidus]PSB33590.1 DUF448 domain-containing protein [Stenomitos frigidus ULC18]